MNDIVSVEVIDGGNAVRVNWHDGPPSRFHAAWLRDNSPDPGTRSADNGQKLITVGDIPTNIAVSAARAINGEAVEISFTPGATPVHFSAGFLAAGIYDRPRVTERGRTAPGVETFDAALCDRLPTGRFDEIRRDRLALGHWLAAVRRFGVALLTDGPVESGALCDVAALFGYVRETNYGRYFDVRSEVKPSNLAYTGLGLQAHTDNPYRDPAPTLQILYCLENSADGGESLVVDGFAAAQRLRDEDGAAFDMLSGYCARFEYAGTPGVRLRAKRPMIELAPDGELAAIRFNNRSTAAIVDVPYDLVPEYYRAWRAFAAIIDDPAMAVTFRLDPGQCFIVDNTRVLHARTAYTGTGTRWLQGCYPDRDGLLSTLAAIEEETGPL